MGCRASGRNSAVITVTTLAGVKGSGGEGGDVLSAGASGSTTGEHPGTSGRRLDVKQLQVGANRPGHWPV